MTKFIYKHKHILLLVLIIAIAAFFRFWNFNSAPPGLYQDEAMNGNDAIASLESGDFKIFYTNNNGREGLIVWLDALAIKMSDNTAGALRFFPALAGVLAVLGLYFFMNELYGLKIALAASYFMATGFWAVNFSRMGFRAGLMIPLLIWSFYFLWRGISKSNVKREVRLRGFLKSDFLFVSAGLLFGLGFYTYISYRFAPVLLLAYFLPYLIKFGNKKIWTGFLLFTVTAFIVALPIGLYFLNNPGDFFGRSGQVSIFSAANPLKAVALSVLGAVGMFNIVGDFNWRHNFAGSPQLLLPVGLLFLFGIILSFHKFELRDKFLLLWLLIFLLPNILTTEGNPHALRAVGAIPAAMAFAGIGLVWVCEKVKKYFDDKIKDRKLAKHHGQLIRIKKEAVLLLIVFLIGVAALEFDKYFLKWVDNPYVAQAFARDQVEIAKYFNNLPPSVEKYALWHPDDRTTDNSLPVAAQTVLYLTREKSEITYLKGDEIDKIMPGKNGAVIIPIYFNTDLLHAINAKFKGSEIDLIYPNVGIVAVPSKK